MRRRPGPGLAALLLLLLLLDVAAAQYTPKSVDAPSTPVQQWTVAEFSRWLVSLKGAGSDPKTWEELARACEEEEVDGALALNMVREDWKSLGASGLKASKVMQGLSRAQRAEQSDEKARLGKARGRAAPPDHSYDTMVKDAKERLDRVRGRET